MTYIDAHVHVWTDDYERFPFAEGTTEIRNKSIFCLHPNSIHIYLH